MIAAIILIIVTGCVALYVYCTKGEVAVTPEQALAQIFSLEKEIDAVRAAGDEVRFNELNRKANALSIAYHEANRHLLGPDQQRYADVLIAALRDADRFEGLDPYRLVTMKITSSDGKVEDRVMSLAAALKLKQMMIRLSRGFMSPEIDLTQAVAPTIPQPEHSLSPEVVGNGVVH